MRSAKKEKLIKPLQHCQNLGFNLQLPRLFTKQVKNVNLLLQKQEMIEINSIKKNNKFNRFWSIENNYFKTAAEAADQTQTFVLIYYR